MFVIFFFSEIIRLRWNFGEKCRQFWPESVRPQFSSFYLFFIKTFKSLPKIGLTFYGDSAGVPPFVICSIPSQVPCTLQKSVCGNWKYGSVPSAVQTHPSLKMCHLCWETQRTMAALQKFGMLEVFLREDRDFPNFESPKVLTRLLSKGKRFDGKVVKSCQCLFLHL